jgi:hypothetical protein
LDEKLKIIETLNRLFWHEIQPVWLIANDPEMSIVCKEATTLTFFGKETTSVASGGQIAFARPKKSTDQGPQNPLHESVILSASTGNR